MVPPVGVTENPSAAFQNVQVALFLGRVASECKQVGWLEHDGRLGETGAAEKRNGAGVVEQFGGVRLLTSRLRFASPRRGRLARISLRQATARQALAPPAACHSRRRAYFCGRLAPIAQMDRAAVS